MYQQARFSRTSWASSRSNESGAVKTALQHDAQLVGMEELVDDED
jgi:hypothetical protein